MLYPAQEKRSVCKNEFANGRRVFEQGLNDRINNITRTYYNGFRVKYDMGLNMGRDSADFTDISGLVKAFCKSCHFLDRKNSLVFTICAQRFVLALNLALDMRSSST